MYRESAAVKIEEREPAELAYAAMDRSRRGKSGMALLQLFSFPAAAGVALSMLAGPTAGLVGLVGAGAGAVWWWRRAPHVGAVVLRVENGELCVLSGDGKREDHRFRLDDVDVVLDTKTIQRVQEGGSAIPAMRFIDATVGPELDTCRIVVVARGTRVPLSDDYVAHMDASEWFGKIRVFLRKNGWTPADEREPESAPSSST